MAAMKKLEKRVNKRIKESSPEDWELIKKDSKIEQAKNNKEENKILDCENNNSISPSEAFDSIENLDSEEIINLKKKNKPKKRRKSTKTENYFGSRTQEELY